MQNQSSAAKCSPSVLKDLEKKGLIEYTLTKKGRALNKTLYERAMFSLEECQNKAFSREPIPCGVKG